MRGWWFIMPRKDPDARREWMRNWVYQRRQRWVEENGPCRICGGSENLEIDHIDPALKAVPIATLWTRAARIREAELAKCQVLCRQCHRKKTIAHNKPGHGEGYWGHYRDGCRCKLCLAAYAASRRRERGKKCAATQGRTGASWVGARHASVTSQPLEAR